MLTFPIILPTIKSLHEYIPQCILCKKEMQIIIDGHFVQSATSSIEFIHPIISPGNRIHNIFYLNIKNNLFVFKSKHYQFSIDNDNKIIEGLDIVNNLTINPFYIIKKCKTCNFMSKFKWNGVNMKTIYFFPPLVQDYECIKYTKNKGKSINIFNYNDKWNAKNRLSNLYIDGKYIDIQDLCIDFSKIKNLKHLNNKISTILTFG